MGPSLGEALVFLSLPFLMCLLTAGIYCYLGLHVLARGVIFVDLSLAQIAAFGATLGVYVGFEHNSFGAFSFSLSTTLLAASLFAMARKYEHRFSQEAIIGIVYALGAAAVVLLVDKMAHGSEHIKGLLVGEILWVSWSDIVKVAIVCAIIGAIHYKFRRQFINASYGNDLKNKERRDFAFYSLFGVVITTTVGTAGVLQIFAFLIVPAVVSSLFFESLKSRLIFGWVFGFFISLIGIGISYVADVPSGASIVVCFACVPILLLVLSPIVKFRDLEI
jgi:zinc/manganese transport system permease protein